MSSLFYFLAILLVASTYYGVVVQAEVGVTEVLHRWGTPGEDDEIIATGNITTKPYILLGFIKLSSREIYTYAPQNVTHLPIITSIEVQDIPEGIEEGAESEVHILYGGVGAKQVAIRFASHRGRGMHNEITIWGRYDNIVVETDEEQSEENDAQR